MVLKEKKQLSIITRIERKNMSAVITGIPYFNEDKETYLNELTYLRKINLKRI